ncbi:MAG: methyltransferase family protein, partial [Opitutaceae bacterium]
SGRPGALWTGLGIALAGVAWVGWTVRFNRWGNFNIRPEPRSGARLITDGPYRWVRHPMYLGSLVIALGACVAGPQVWRFAAWGILAIVLIAKARREERGLLAQFPEYESYRRGRAFLIPGVW